MFDLTPPSPKKKQFIVVNFDLYFLSSFNFSCQFFSVTYFYDSKQQFVSETSLYKKQ